MHCANQQVIMKRSAMTITELLTGLAVLAILAGVTSLSPDLYKQTSKREAERVYAKLLNVIHKADTERIAFNLEVRSQQIIIHWYAPNAAKDEKFPASRGCSYSWVGVHKNVNYSYINNRFAQGGHIIVKGKGPMHYLIIYTVGSRIRLSDTPPASS